MSEWVTATVNLIETYEVSSSITRLSFTDIMIDRKYRPCSSRSHDAPKRRDTSRVKMGRLQQKERLYFIAEIWRTSYIHIADRPHANVR